MMLIDISGHTRSFLSSLPPKQYRQVVEKIMGVASDPNCHDRKHLSGKPGYFRVDVGEYRIIYAVLTNVIRIPLIGQRNDDRVYREADRLLR